MPLMPSRWLKLLLAEMLLLNKVKKNLLATVTKQVGKINISKLILHVTYQSN